MKHLGLSIRILGVLLFFSCCSQHTPPTINEDYWNSTLCKDTILNGRDFKNLDSTFFISADEDVFPNANKANYEYYNLLIQFRPFDGGGHIYCIKKQKNAPLVLISKTSFIYNNGIRAQPTDKMLDLILRHDYKLIKSVIFISNKGGDSIINILRQFQKTIHPFQHSDSFTEGAGSLFLGFDGEKYLGFHSETTSNSTMGQLDSIMEIAIGKKVAQWVVPPKIDKK